MPVVPNLPDRLFARELHIGKKSQVAKQLPRFYSSHFDIREAQLGDLDQHRFLAAIAIERPTVINSRNLCSSIAKLTDKPVVICWDGIDVGMKRIFASEGISYIKDKENALLPFLGAAISSDAPSPSPGRLSPQAQRILFNVLDGTWENFSAGEIAKAIGKSNASVTKYLSEIEAIVPALVTPVGKSRVLKMPPNVTRQEVLEAFEPFLSSPVVRTYRIAELPNYETIKQSGALLAGESALSALTDLADNPDEVVIALDTTGIDELSSLMGDSWQSAQWYENAPLVVEEWRYHPGLAKKRNGAEPNCVDLPSLYATVRDKNKDDIRFTDAVEQIKELICR